MKRKGVNLSNGPRRKHHRWPWKLLAVACSLVPSGACFAEPFADTPAVERSGRATFRDCETCPNMIALSAEITGEALSFSVHELTWAEYAASVDAARCPLPKTLGEEVVTSLTFDVRDDYPMTSLPPAEIQCYLKWLSKASGHSYRLPTEAEWQAVARAGGSEVIEEDLPEFEPGAASDRRTTVQRRVIRRVAGQYHPAVGLYDLFGNASEVVSSERGGEGWVIVRGGNSFETDDFDPVEGWHRVPATSSSATVGFRIVREGSR